MTIDIPVGFGGRFRVEKICRNGERVIAADWHKNLITDNGLNKLATSTLEFIRYCQVGSGTATPAEGDTQLAGFIASAIYTGSSDGRSTTPGNRYEWKRYTYQFDEGAVVGNISELGISPDNSGNLFSRALVKDSNGNPTTISVLADEILVVTYELRLYKPEGDFVGSSNGYNYTARIAKCDSNYDWSLYTAKISFFTGSSGNNHLKVYASGIGEIDSDPYQSGYSSDSATPANVFTNSYVNGSFKLSGGAVFDLDEANFTIRSSRFCVGKMTFQVEIDPPITKNNTQKLTLWHTISWGRYEGD
ncbi:hypothetical protein [Microbulbifer sp. JMSA003]|uniref:hypothetical protein n=1 Tax=Microbulbifer sp. JMSA003 TaxID=3243369 RepID=UPI004039F43B